MKEKVRSRPNLMAVKAFASEWRRVQRIRVRNASASRDGRHQATVRKAITMGVRIAVGTTGIYPHGRNAELHLLVDRGLKPIDALATTSVDAGLFGIADRTGTLEAGKLADVIAVPGDRSRTSAPWRR
jgi:imidazolonepropionase-like amidohydrolase